MLHPGFLLRLEKVRAEWNKPLIITSGYRCSAHNAEVGGVQNSYHKRGLACDISIEAQEQENFRALALAQGFTKVITYPERKFIHIELGEHN